MPGPQSSIARIAWIVGGALAVFAIWLAINQSGGTFTCNAALYVGVPASAGEGVYGGGLVLTLL